MNIFAMLPDEVSRALGSGSGELSVLHALGSHLNDNLEYSASVRCLAAMARLSERQTIRVLHQLREKRLIAFDDNLGGRGKITTYRLLFSLSKTPTRTP